MKRATITIPDDLERQLETYLDDLEARPTLTAVVQAALRNYLQTQRLQEREFRPARRKFSITPAPTGSGRSDISQHHDRYLADDEP